MRQACWSLFAALFVYAQQIETAKTNTAGTTVMESLVVNASTIAKKDLILERPEVMASVDKVLWRRHLEKNLLPILLSALKAGMKPGKYVVNVRFIVERDGSIVNLVALNDFGYGLAQGAVNVVKTGPRWQPGEQNHLPVRSFHTTNYVCHR